MNVFPRSALSTTSVFTRFAVAKRNDSSAGFGGSAFLAASDATGFGSEPQETMASAMTGRAMTGRAMSGTRIDSKYITADGCARRTGIMSRMTFIMRSKFAACILALALAGLLPAQNSRHLTTPQEALGFEIGDDYHLANYTQLTQWWQKLAAESDRMKLVEIGKTEEGRPQWMAILTSPENQRHLDRYKEISSKLAHAEGLTDDQAHALAHEGKAVIWID